MQNVFLEQFLMISEWKTLGFILAFIVIALILWKLPKEKFNFSNRVLIATVLGLVLGFAMQVISGFSDDPSQITFVKETTLWYGLIGKGFISFIRMLVIPLVMVSIIHVILHMEEGSHVRKLVQRGILTTMGMVMLSAIVGVVIGIIFQVGGNPSMQIAGEDAAQIKEVVPVVTTLLNLIPSNPVEAMVNNNIVGVVIFSTFIGLAARKMQKKYPEILRVFYDLLDASHKIVISMAMSVI